MRDIKFRAHINGEWHYFTLGDLVCGSITATEFCDYEFDAETWTQFTGLLDKNGKEIYEGDIVTAGGLTCVVEWKKHGWAATWTKKEPYQITKQSGSPSLGFREHEIIGNIYENPELLEES